MQRTIIVVHGSRTNRADKDAGLLNFSVGLARHGFAVLAFDSHAAEIYATMAAVIRRAGRNPRPRRMDLQIAATAAAHSIPLITRDAGGLTGLERLLDVVVV